MNHPVALVLWGSAGCRGSAFKGHGDISQQGPLCNILHPFSGNLACTMVTGWDTNHPPSPPPPSVRAPAALVIDWSAGDAKETKSIIGKFQRNRNEITHLHLILRSCNCSLAVSAAPAWYNLGFIVCVADNLSCMCTGKGKPFNSLWLGTWDFPS